MNIGQNALMRALRSGVLACLTIALASAAHGLGDGEMAPWWLLGFGVLTSAPFLYAMSAQRWNFAHIAAFMAIVQVLMHAAMSMGMPAGHHAHAGDAALHTQGPNISMAAAHIVATGLLSLAFAYGERALHWTLSVLVRFGGLEPTPFVRWRRVTTRTVMLRESQWVAAHCAGRAPPRVGRIRLAPLGMPRLLR